VIGSIHAREYPCAIAHTIALQFRDTVFGRMRLVSALCLGWLFLLVTAEGAESKIDFNRDIRPILSENCFYCHGQDGAKREANLRLDQRAGALEGEAFVPGDSDASEMIYRILTDDENDLMPPPDSNRKLSEEEKKLLQEWVSDGADYDKHWAFVSPQRPRLPEVNREEWIRNPIDRFVLAKLEQENLIPAGEADRTTLMKRLYADLVGLAPSPEEVEAFAISEDPQAYEKLVDQLLASPHYGERLALPWLDAARYADSNGFQQDGETWQWMWRDWVVKAINEDLPFDQFTIWQLAGDLLPESTDEQKIASGFNRNHLSNGEGGAIPEEQRFVVLFDRVDTTATTWLGLTMACAQCHDHKYDPITLADYYQFLDAFNHVRETGRPGRQSTRIRVATPFLELPTEENTEEIAAWNARISAQRKIVEPIVKAERAKWEEALTPEDKSIDNKLKGLLANKNLTEAEQKSLSQQLRSHFDKLVRPKLNENLPELKKLEGLNKKLVEYKGEYLPRPMVMNDDQKRQTHILDRGAYLSPLKPVSFATPSFLPPQAEDAPRNRLGLAQWLVEADHPLTARVQVNRMWQYFFGVGIVKTSEDLGVQSEYPEHMALLDWLATEFVEQGWSMKAMHRLIVTSAAYRQDSRMNDWHREHDPENRLVSRGSRFRMPSMVLRDWALSSSGLINPEVGGKPVYPYQPENPWETLAQVTKERDFSYPTSSGKDLYRRSIYSFWRRTVTPANLFDASSRQVCRVTESRNNTPLHALTTLNDPTWVEASRVLAARVMEQEAEHLDQLLLAFQSVTGRVPSNEEQAMLDGLYQKQFFIYQSERKAAEAFLSVGESPPSESLPIPEHAAMTAACLAIFNLDESLTRL
tara:strand:- start:13491 stop:16094 length:2604 start_codon:yes stop_codon:yes gene_type:complete